MMARLLSASLLSVLAACASSLALVGRGDQGAGNRTQVSGSDSDGHPAVVELPASSSEAEAVLEVAAPSGKVVLSVSLRKIRSLMAAVAAEANSSSPLLPEERLRVLCHFKSLVDESFVVKLPHPASPHCAVVSSSGAMLNHRHGAEIDNHAVVMRFNAAPTEGYKKYVGGKTTWRWGWAAPNSGPEKKVIDENDVSESSKRNLKSAVKKLYPTQLGYNAETDALTTGFTGMIIALVNCGVVDAYEMAPSKYAENAPYNYFGHTGMKATDNTYHGLFKAEHDFWGRVASNSEAEQSEEGKTVYLGFSQLECPTQPHTLDSLE